MNLCPLCESDEVSVLEKIRSADVIRLYIENLQINTSDIFHNIDDLFLSHCQMCDLSYFLPFTRATESFYESLQKVNWYYLDEKFEYHFAMRYIKKRDRILEIGCGTGAFAKILGDQIYTGLEFNRQAIKATKALNLNVLNQSVEEFSTNKPGQFDVVCAFQVLEHVSNIKSFIQASIRCLRTGGLLIFSVPSADSFLRQSTNNYLNLPPHHESWWSDNCLRKVAGLFDLVMVELFHDRLDKIHKLWYLRVLVENSIKKKINYKSSIVDVSTKLRIIKKISSLVALFLINGLDDITMLPYGHTVTAVYRKK